MVFRNLDKEKMKGKIRIIARDYGNQKDEKLAKQLEGLFNDQFDKYEGIISALTRIEIIMPKLYGKAVRVPHKMIEKVMEEIIKMEIKEKK